MYDDELRLEAYHFEGTRQPFPNHFHEYYVIGFVEDGTRRLFCRNREYSIEKGSIVLFNPGDNHACVQSDDGTFDYRGFNIAKEVMLNLAEEVPPVEVAIQTRFSDQSHFTNYFNQFIGLTPGIYR